MGREGDLQGALDVWKINEGDQITSDQNFALVMDA